MFSGLLRCRSYDWNHHLLDIHNHFRFRGMTAASRNQDDLRRMMEEAININDAGAKVSWEITDESNCAVSINCHECSA